MKKIIIILIIGVILVLIFAKKAVAGSSVPLPNNTTFQTSQAIVNKVNQYDAICTQRSFDYGIPVARIKAHIAVESGGNANAVGAVGEIGLMQMTQEALNDVNANFSSQAPLVLTDLYQPNYGIAAGTAYLALLLNQTGNLDEASEAYNVGVDNIGSTNALTYKAKILAYEQLF